MSIDTLFYLTGIGVWALVAIIVLLFTLFIAWKYISIAVSFWWVHIKAMHKYPNCDAVSKEYRSKRFWKLRLLASTLIYWRTIASLNGSRSYGYGWKADYTGFFPRVSTIDYS